MPRPLARPFVTVAVFRWDGKLLPDAEVLLLTSTAGQPILLSFNADWQSHVATHLPLGSYRLQARAAGLEDQEREVVIESTGLREFVMLGEPKMRFFYSDRVRVPFRQNDELLAVAVDPSADRAEEAAQVAELMTRWRLEPFALPEPVREAGVIAFRVDKGTSDARIREILHEMAGWSIAEAAGQVLRLDSRSITFLSQDIVAQFRPGTKPNQIAENAERFGLEVFQQLPYLDNGYVLRASDGSYTAVLDACESLVRSGMVVFAEPDLVSTPTQMQVAPPVVPPDYLFPQQLHMQKVGLTSAWGALRAKNVNCTYGSPDVVIAVLDQGIESEEVGGVVRARHPEFQGNLTDGGPKVSVFFDFPRKRPDNNVVNTLHGLACGGIAAAQAENPTLGGEYEGMAGAAGNCRLMGLVRPGNWKQTGWREVYLWIAGFDPKSKRKKFPAQLRRGADVITNSFRVFGGYPITGTMRTCFDHLTANGRKKRGVILCFAAGNGDESGTVGLDFLLPAPWAAYEKTIAVAASTLWDVRAPYSNFGVGIDLCAPSSVGYPTGEVFSCARVGAGNTAGHTGGSLDYTATFSGTSAATPLVAGVAALALTANPLLSWDEVLDVLCRKARKIDLASPWIDLDSDGAPDYSLSYGFGCLDAAAAIPEVLAAAAPP
jgi:hypothetical protein